MWYVDKPSSCLAYGKPELNVHMWYMTRPNYHDMHMGRLVNVILPIFTDSNYTVHLYGTVSKPYAAPRCHVSLPSGHHTPVKITDKKLNRWKHPIPAQTTNSGLYLVACSVRYTDAIEGGSHRLELKKSLKITFIKGTNESSRRGRR